MDRLGGWRPSLRPIGPKRSTGAVGPKSGMEDGTVSYDLHVFGRAEAPEAVMSSVLQLFAHVLAKQGASVPDARTGGLLSVDGPLRVEREDVPDEVLDRVLAPTVVFQLSAGGGYPPAAARRLAKALAAALEGAVYDCQDDAVTWPRARTGHRRAEPVRPVDGLIDGLHLSWYFRPVDLPDAFEQQLLDHLRRSLPEAVPQRYDGIEPPQHRLDRDGDAHFTAFAARRDGVFWTARRPVVGGSYHRLLAVHGPRSRGRQVGVLELDLLLDGIDTPAWRDELRHALVDVAGLCHAFYAQAAVGYGYRGKDLSSDGDTRHPAPLATGYGWQGLPDHPVWLAWFGNLYRPLVEPQLGAQLPLVVTDEHPRRAERLPLPSAMQVTQPYRIVPGQTASVVPPELQQLS